MGRDSKRDTDLGEVHIMYRGDVPELRHKTQKRFKSEATMITTL